MRVRPGDLIRYYRDTVLIIACERVCGYIGINAWEITYLARGPFLRKGIIHDENVNKTWWPLV